MLLFKSSFEEPLSTCCSISDAPFQIVIRGAIVDMLFDKSFCAHFVFPSSRLYHLPGTQIRP